MERILPKERIIIFGGSGGIGSELAYGYARSNRYSSATLELWARDVAKLDRIGQTCRDLGLFTITRSIDLINVDEALTLLQQEDERHPIDLVIFASGSGDVRRNAEQVDGAELVTRLASMNYAAPAALASFIAGRMAQRGTGAIAFIGSAAASHSLPSAPSYAASKAGLERFADALRISVKKHGVSVTLVSPGFVDTQAGRQTAGNKPFLIDPSHAADRIRHAIERRKAHLIFPWPFVVLRWLDRLLPRHLRDFLMLQTMPKE